MNFGQVFSLILLSLFLLIFMAKYFHKCSKCRNICGLEEPFKELNNLFLLLDPEDDNRTNINNDNENIINYNRKNKTNYNTNNDLISENSSKRIPPVENEEGDNFPPKEIKEKEDNKESIAIKVNQDNNQNQRKDNNNDDENSNNVSNDSISSADENNKSNEIKDENEEEKKEEDKKIIYERK